jgi:probable addiction module antidote protein
MAKTRTRRWDPADNLKTPHDIAAYLNAALEEDDPVLFLAALGDVARARGMTDIAKITGLGRESLYKALAPGAQPRYDTVIRVMHAVGVKLEASVTA